MSERILKIVINAGAKKCDGCSSASYQCMYNRDKWQYVCTLFNQVLTTNKDGDDPDRLQICRAFEREAGKLVEECSSCGENLGRTDEVCEHCGEPTGR